MNETHKDSSNVGGKNHDDVPVSRWNYILALSAAVNSCNLGYDLGVGTDVGRLVQSYFNLSTFQRDIFTGSIDFWSSKYKYLFVMYCVH